MQARTFLLLGNGHLMISRSEQTGQENSDIITCSTSFLVKKQWIEVRMVVITVVNFGSALM